MPLFSDDQTPCGRNNVVLFTLSGYDSLNRFCRAAILILYLAPSINLVGRRRRPHLIQRQFYWHSAVSSKISLPMGLVMTYDFRCVFIIRAPGRSAVCTRVRVCIVMSVRASVRLCVRLSVCNHFLWTKISKSYERILVNFWSGKAWPREEWVRFWWRSRIQIMCLCSFAYGALQSWL